MKTVKYILIALGLIAIVLSVVFMIIGWKVVSAVAGYIIGAIAIIALIIFIIYFIGKMSGRSQSTN